MRDDPLEDALAATGEPTKEVPLRGTPQALRRHLQKTAIGTLVDIGWEGDLDAIRNDWTRGPTRTPHCRIVAESPV